MKTTELKDYLIHLSRILLSEPTGDFHHPCIVVNGNSSYPRQLWDWGNWANDIALSQLSLDGAISEDLFPYQKGSVLNFLREQKEDGSIEIVVFSDPEINYIKKMPHKNVHKPVLAQHVAMIVKEREDLDWVREIYPSLERLIAYYEKNAKHESGLFYFFDDFAIGVDNDPSTFFRPESSSASIFLNTLMYTELSAMAHLAHRLDLPEKEALYSQKRDALKEAVNACCWDEKDGMFYSCDIDLRPIDPQVKLHSKAPRHYSTLIRRLGSWSSFLPLWAGIATPEQAKRIIEENLLDEKAFWAPFGIRSLSKYEKMYRIIGTSNPSNWHGPVWILSNYFLCKALDRYGYKEQAASLAEKTVSLLAKDLEENGAFHEYYDPETGKGMYNKGFSSWNLLAANLMAYLEGRPLAEEITF